MIVKKAKRAVRHGRGVIKMHGGDGLLHEANTHYYIIDPILRAMGWNLGNPKQLKFEEWGSLYNQQRVADYLLHRSEKNLVVIEAKGWSKTKLQGYREENQLKEIAWRSDAELAVLTNGQSWYFYNLAETNRKRDFRAEDYYAYICDTESLDVAAKDLHQRLNKRRLWKID